MCEDREGRKEGVREKSGREREIDIKEGKERQREEREDASCVHDRVRSKSEGTRGTQEREDEGEIERREKERQKWKEERGGVWREDGMA